VKDNRSAARTGILKVWIPSIHENEEYEPDLRKLDYLPRFDLPVDVVFNTDEPNTQVTFFHQLLTIPRGFMVIGLEGPMVIYATSADKALWTLFTVTLRADFVNPPETPIDLTGRIVLL